MLVTSREVLGVTGEKEFSVSPRILGPPEAVARLVGDAIVSSGLGRKRDQSGGEYSPSQAPIVSPSSPRQASMPSLSAHLSLWGPRAALSAVYGMKKARAGGGSCWLASPATNACSTHAICGRSRR